MPKKTKETDVKKDSNAKSTKKETKKVASKKSTQKKETAKEPKVTKSITKKSSSKTSKSKKNLSSKKKNNSKKETSKKELQSFTPEYYDLPYRYNQTIVKILAQTPTNLFIYWDISDEDRQNLKNTYGEYFFEITKPVLIVHNKTMNYSFEIDIDDFANSWYLHVDDSNCEYELELGRRPSQVNYNYIPNYNIEESGPINPLNESYIYISSSNDIISPNDRVLFNLKNKILFRNIKTNETIEKDISEFPFLNINNKFCSIYEIYKSLYKDELLHNQLDFTNPSSSNPSSGSFSSMFK